LDRFDVQVAAQQVMADRFRYLSPAIVAQFAFNDLAGASAHRYAHPLPRAGERLSSPLARVFTPRILKKEKMSVDDLAKLPKFADSDEDASAVRVASPWRCWAC
jgi:ABC-2 type transport system permease protein